MTVKKFIGWCPKCGLMAAAEDKGACPGCGEKYAAPLAQRPEAKKDNEPQYQKVLRRCEVDGAFEG